MGIRFGSACSGIEAASAAWEVLGWQPCWFTEIEDAPSSVLAHRFPDVENFGDMTLMRHYIELGDAEAPDVLVGGTPCQAFSVAGSRNSLGDDRGQLTLEFVKLADSIDEVRAEEGKDDCVIVWENVPGVLTTKDNAFGCFLGSLAGDDCELEPEPKPEKGKSGRYWRWNKTSGDHSLSWPKSGCVYGPKRAIAWRILDAQYFGVAQRRRRVFVVASARAGFDPAAVLFEFEGVRRDTPPSREQGQGFAADVAPSLVASGRGVERIGETRGQDPVVAVSTYAARGHYGGYVDADVADPLRAKGGDTGYGTESVAVHGTQDPDVNTELAHTVGRNSGQENAVLPVDVRGCFWNGEQVTQTLDAVLHKGQTMPEKNRFPAVLQRDWGRLSEGDIDEIDRANSEDPAPKVCAAFAENSRGELRLEGGDGSRTGAVNTGGGKPGQGVPSIVEAEVAPTLDASMARKWGSNQWVNTWSPVLNLQAALDLRVRRLTPVECERLQGFPDNWTFVPHTGRNRIDEETVSYLSQFFPGITKELASGYIADSHRYKAIGNSKAVTVVRWLGRRIEHGIDLCERLEGL